MTKDLKWMQKAMILGFSFFVAVLLVKPVGVTTQFSVATGIVHSAVDPNVITENAGRESGYESTNAYYDRSEGKLAKSIKNPLNYSFIFVLAIPAGAYVENRLKNKKNLARKAPSKSSTDRSVQPKLSAKDYLPSFVSGFLLLFGARMAGGCTSGHMMSGIMQSSVSGFVFAASVFVVAIPIAVLTSNKNLMNGGHV